MAQTAGDALTELRERGFIKQCSDSEGLRKVLDAGPVTFYCGFDPTGPSLHIGHMVPVFAMAHLARAGHHPIALVGGGTARIGDPSGKITMRKMLSIEQIQKNTVSIGAQIEGFLQRAGADASVTMVDNADWLAQLNYISFLRDIGVHFSVNRMLSFETYKMRMETGLSFIEFNYQLLQSYDFMILNKEYGCRLQIGGDDQWGNIVAGADLIRRVSGGDGKFDEVFALTFPLVTTSDGKKMGKTEQGSLFLDPAVTPPIEIFQYWRNIDDADVGRFLRMFTFLPLDEIREFERYKDAAINQAKEKLAFEFVSLIHGHQIADECLAAARAAFGGDTGGLANVPTLTLASHEISGGVSVLDILVRTGLSESKGDARRLVQQGAVALGARKIEDIAVVVDQGVWDACRNDDGSLLVRAGKKRFHRLVLG